MDKATAIKENIHNLSIVLTHKKRYRPVIAAFGLQDKKEKNMADETEKISQHATVGFLYEFGEWGILFPVIPL